MAPKRPKPQPDPSRSGASASKGKEKAHKPSPPPEDQADQPEPSYGAPDDFSDFEDGAPAVIPEKPKHEGKHARQAREEAEREYAYTKYKEKQAVLEAGPNQEEVEHFMGFDAPTTDLSPEPPLRTAETSSASRPTSLWSENSEQYLRVPQQGGTSSSASSRASKRNRSPSPHGYRDTSRTAHRGRGGRTDSRPPPGQMLRPSREMEDEIHNLQTELQRLREYGREDREHIRTLERQLAAERQLGVAEGLAQAA